MLAMLVVFASCEKETLLTVDQTTLSYTDAGGSQSINLTANKPWSASSNQSWCKVSPSGGEEATGSRISISCDANTTYDARNATVTIACAELTKTVDISQATNNGLLVSQTSYELTKAAQQINIQVQANVKFSVEVDNGCKDWIKYNTTKGLTTSTVVLDIAENKTYDSREGKVTIKQDEGNLSSTVTIKQSQLDGLFISTPEYNLSNEKHTLTVEVSTNVEFDVKPEADWVNYVQTKGLNTKQIILEVEENDTYDQRETQVNVKQKNGDLSGTITIRQDEKYGILVSQSEFNLSNEATTIAVEVKYNVDFDVVIPDNCKAWIKKVSTKSLESKTYTFSISKNETYDNREGSITFKQKNGAISTTVEIIQSQKDGIIAEQTEYVISFEEQQLDIKVKSNINYEVIIDDSCTDWLSRIQTKGLVEETLSFQVAKNEGETRTGRVILKNESLQETITIKQEAEGYVEFSDDNFKSYCVQNFDKNGDGEISFSEALIVTIIEVCTDNIVSLQGIEYFTNLQDLLCEGSLIWDDSLHIYVGEGQLSSLDVSENTSLTELRCACNQLTSLDVSKNTALEVLRCDYNQLTSLDVSKNTALDALGCACNQLTSLDVSMNTALISLFCYGNQLTSLDVSKNTALEVLSCVSNQLTSLDVSKNTALEGLDCESNQLTSLDVSNNTALEGLDCGYNQLMSIDVSKNTALISLHCACNQLTSLDVSMNTALISLFCYGNQLTSLDVSEKTSLTELRCEDNQLTSLDVSKNTALTYLYCYSNQLTSLDVSQNPALTWLYCNSNQLTSLDASKNTALTWLLCRDNQLTSLDVSKNTALISLHCACNQLTSLDVSNNSLLNQLYCYKNPYLTEIWLKTGQTISDFQYDEDVATIKYK